MTTFDFSPLYRSAIGFDRLANLLSNASRADQGQSYPPYNIEVTGEDEYRITMAVAGFADADIEITCEQNKLTVLGSKKAQRMRANTCIAASPNVLLSDGSNWPIMFV